jgi:gluconate 5-dehydrogenase
VNIVDPNSLRAQDASRRPAHPFDLHGRVALVTGAARGLGFEMAKSLAEAGATVYISGRSEAILNASADRLRRLDLDVRALPFDVADEAAGIAAIERLRREHQRLDILVNNVGERLRRTADKISWREFANLLNVDLIGAFALSKAAAEMMTTHGFGRIIMVTSTSATLASAADAAYIAAKGGLSALTRALACEYGPRGITCNALCPGPFMTETNANLAKHPGIAAWIPTRVPVGRWGNPEEIGPACLFLAAPASSFVNGHTLVVDGGITASVGSPQYRESNENGAA